MRWIHSDISMYQCHCSVFPFCLDNECNACLVNQELEMSDKWKNSAYPDLDDNECTVTIVHPLQPCSNHLRKTWIVHDHASDHSLFGLCLNGDSCGCTPFWRHTAIYIYIVICTSPASIPYAPLPKACSLIFIHFSLSSRWIERGALSRWRVQAQQL